MTCRPLPSIIVIAPAMPRQALNTPRSLSDACQREIAADDYGLRERHETFTFDNGHGLGVIRKAGGDRCHDPDLVTLRCGRDYGRERLRAFSVHASRYLNTMRKLKRFATGPRTEPAA